MLVQINISWTIFGTNRIKMAEWEGWRAVDFLASKRFLWWSSDFTSFLNSQKNNHTVRPPHASNNRRPNMEKCVTISVMNAGQIPRWAIYKYARVLFICWGYTFEILCVTCNRGFLENKQATELVFNKLFRHLSKQSKYGFKIHRTVI